MKKLKLVALIAGASLVTTAGIASATQDGILALYGSSAQAKFWAAQAGTWMTNSLGCSGVPSAATSATNANYPGETFYTISGTNCSNTDAKAVAGTGTLTVLYTANDSVTGIQSVNGSVNADGCTNANQRVMYPGTGTANCQTITVGIADVAASAITEQSSGYKTGPLDTTGVTFAPNYSAGSPALATITTTGLNDVTANKTLATPFAFWVNKGVTAKQCTAGLVGNYCYQNTDCNTVYGTNNGTCNTTPTTITNLTRLQATLLFSGQVQTWDQLGQYFTAQPVILCLRHAGSGTHATLDNAVMTAGQSGWGSPLVTAQQSPTDASNNGTTITWFNNASGDEMNCVNGDTTAANSIDGNAYPSGTTVGAIGYSDADASAGSNTVEIKYNGYFPTRSGLRDGVYDFYAIAHYYTSKTGDAAHNTLATDMIKWAESPANMAPAKANYWATVAEMNVYKTSDTAYPLVQGNSSPYFNNLNQE